MVNFPVISVFDCFSYLGDPELEFVGVLDISVPFLVISLYYKSIS